MNHIDIEIHPSKIPSCTMGCSHCNLHTNHEGNIMGNKMSSQLEISMEIIKELISETLTYSMNYSYDLNKNIDNPISIMYPEKLRHINIGQGKIKINDSIEKTTEIVIHKLEVLFQELENNKHSSSIGFVISNDINDIFTHQEYIKYFAKEYYKRSQSKGFQGASIIIGNNFINSEKNKTIYTEIFNKINEEIEKIDMFSEDSKYTHEKKERFTDEYATTSKYKFTKHTQSNFWEEFSMRFISPTDLYKNYDSNQRAEELLLLPIHYIALYAHGIFLQHSSVDIKNIHLRHSHQKFIDTYNKFKKDIGTENIGLTKIMTEMIIDSLWNGPSDEQKKIIQQGVKKYN